LQYLQTKDVKVRNGLKSHILPQLIQFFNAGPLCVPT